MKQLLIFITLFVSITTNAVGNPLWLQHSAISPDGKDIAFSYKGDIYLVSTEGGVARQMTTNAAYDAYPVWSPDGQKIAFASTREGSFDIYLMSRWGGEPRRLTTSSNSEIPMAFADNDNVLYLSNIMPTTESIFFPSSSQPQVYKVAVDGSRPTMFSALTMEDICINRSNGNILFHDAKGYEDPFRKHHKSPIARDIWLQQGEKYTKLTSFEGEDRTPRWAADGQSFYYLSEESGSFNVYKRNIDSDSKQQLTFHAKHPVRSLTVADNETLCYTYDGEIYTVYSGGTPAKVEIYISADRNDRELIRQTLPTGASEITLSPNGKELAFVVHGDVYVTSLEYKTTKQITDTPEEERNICFSPDGKKIAYTSERDGLWQIYQTTAKNSKESNFTYATDLEEKRLTETSLTALLPKYSPDGEKIAFFENRSTLKVLDLKTKKTTTALDGKYVFSYSDGDIWFEWSPDSKWLLAPYIGEGGWNNTDVALVSADGNTVHNLTQSGYNESPAKWALNGKAILFYSDRAGYRSHGSWGAEQDAYLMFFDLDAYEQFRMNKEEKALFDEQKSEEEKAKASQKEGKKDEKKGNGSKNKNNGGKKKDSKKEESKPAVEPLKFDIDNCRDRIVRMTVNSSFMADAVLSPQADTLYYLARFEGDYDLWKHEIKAGKTEIVMKGVGAGELHADKNFKNIFVASNGTIRKIDIASGQPKNIEFEARFNYKPYKEREYMFNHVWRQIKDKFYVENLHDVDWDYYKKSYERFLPHINNRYDFSNMLSEMLGELNASHTGARFFASGASMQTATLGAFFDNDYDGDGLRVAEVLKKGPLAVRNTGVTKGTIIEKIDGEPIIKGKDYNYMLDGKAGKRVRLTILDPGKKASRDIIVRPITNGEQNELLYKRWVERNRKMVDSLSNGRIAYVHVKAMNSESFRTVFSELLNDENRNKDAVIVDDRHNGGGWLHDDLCTLLSGKQYQSFVPQGRKIGIDPWNKWTKPSCVLICEDDYSNGHGFPLVYKTLGIGKLIGAPVAGTMTAVWWETLIDKQLVYGIPQVGCVDMNGEYEENQQLNPDILIYNTPEDYLTGRDRQIEEAVRMLLKK